MEGEAFGHIQFDVKAIKPCLSADSLTDEDFIGKILKFIHNIKHSYFIFKVLGGHKSNQSYKQVEWTLDIKHIITNKI